MARSTSHFLFRLVYNASQHYTVNVRDGHTYVGDVAAISSGTYRWFYLLEGETADGTTRSAYRTRAEAAYALSVAYRDRLREHLLAVAAEHVATLDARKPVSLAKGVNLAKRVTLRADEAVRSYPSKGGRVSLAKAAPAPFDVVGFIIAAETGDLSPLEYLEGIGHLIRTGTVWGLQGSWQRAAQSCVQAGFLDRTTGNLTDEGVEYLESLGETVEA